MMQSDNLGSVFSNFKMYGSGNNASLVKDERPVQHRLDQLDVAKALGGVNFHGDGGDYIDMGNLSMNEFGHGGDEGKLPWHPSFSNQSAFATNTVKPIYGVPKIAEGGTWVARGENGSKKDVFSPSVFQAKQPWFKNNLQRYYTNERGAGIDEVNMPIPYDNIRYTDVTDRRN